MSRAPGSTSMYPDEHLTRAKYYPECPKSIHSHSLRPLRPTLRALRQNASVEYPTQTYRLTRRHPAASTSSSRQAHGAKPQFNTDGQTLAHA